MVYYEIAGIIPINKMKPCFGVVVYKIKHLVGLNQSRPRGKSQINHISIEPHFVVDGDGELYLSEVSNINGLVKNYHYNFNFLNNENIKTIEYIHYNMPSLNDDELPQKFCTQEIIARHINCYYVDANVVLIGTNEYLRKSLTLNIEELLLKEASLLTILEFSGQNEIQRQLIKVINDFKSQNNLHVCEIFKLTSELSRKKSEIQMLCETARTSTKDRKTQNNPIANVLAKRNTTKT